MQGTCQSPEPGIDKVISMPPSFAGMNPYLEYCNLWPAFHPEFIAYLAKCLRTSLTDRHGLQIAKRQYLLADSPATSAEQQHQQENYIEIHDKQHGRLLTLLDMVSPLNKTTGSGRQAYLETRRTARAAKANLVEIDLILQGQPTLEYSREGLPDWDYTVTVTRAAQPDRFELYVSTLPKRLPRFSLPLASDERNVVVDLGTLFSRALSEGGFDTAIDYRMRPP
jgi:hypothetical protein